MTLSAARKPGSADYVTVKAAYGPVTFEIDEPRGHLLHFWHELGKLVAAADNERRAQEGYERYRQHCGGVSVHGEPLPAWAGQAPEIRQHWVAAFTE